MKDHIMFTRQQKILPVAIIIIALVLSAVLVFAAEQTAKPIVPKEKTSLFNGEDFSGWSFYLDPEKGKGVDTKDVWSVKDGVVHCKGLPFGYMRTEKEYSNYILHLEWRWPEEATNSGVLLHVLGKDAVWPRMIECQLESGNAGDFWLIKGVHIAGHTEHTQDYYNVKKLKPSSEKPAGEWNTYEIICKNGTIVPIVNGVIQNVATGAELTFGSICLQSEGSPIEFRNIYLEPVD